MNYIESTPQTNLTCPVVRIKSPSLQTSVNLMIYNKGLLLNDQSCFFHTNNNQEFPVVSKSWQALAVGLINPFLFLYIILLYFYYIILSMEVIFLRYLNY